MIPKVTSDKEFDITTELYSIHRETEGMLFTKINIALIESKIDKLDKHLNYYSLRNPE